MSKQSKTPFTDKFFQVSRRITYFTLGADSSGIFEHVRPLDLNGSDTYSLYDATGISTKRGEWLIGIFEEPVAVCGQLYPKHTVAVFEGRTAGCRFALFSVDDADTQQ